MKPGVPELYLYSETDELTNPSRLLHLIGTRKDRYFFAAAFYATWSLA